MGYKDWIRDQICCVSGYQGESIDPHHVIGYSWLTGKGMGKKGSDLSCIPLRHDLHNELHNMGWVSFEKKYNISQIEVVVKMILKAESEGMVNILGET